MPSLPVCMRDVKRRSDADLVVVRLNPATVILNSRANYVSHIRSYLGHYSFQNITPANYNSL